MLAWFGDLEVVDDLVGSTWPADGDAFHGGHAGCFRVVQIWSGECLVVWRV